MRFWKKLALATALAGAAVIPASPAWPMTVQPVVIDLTAIGSSMSRVVTVENTFATRLPVELRIEELAFENGQLVNTHKDPGDLLVFPPQAMIEPGQTQSFRVQYVGDPDLAQSKHYYVTVAQLPVKLAEGQSAIQILYNFQVLVSVAPAQIRPAIAIVSAGVETNREGKPVPAVTVSNTSNAHGYLSKGRLKITQFNDAGEQVFSRSISGPEMLQIVGFGLVGANTTRTIQIPVELPATGGRVDAKFTPE
ncbi:MAG: fimbria/pilus periplasmic chaperone [Erythrobacter sp.]